MPIRVMYRDQMRDNMQLHEEAGLGDPLTDSSEAC